MNLGQEGKPRQEVQGRKLSVGFGMTSSLVQLKHWICGGSDSFWSGTECGRHGMFSEFYL